MVMDPARERRYRQFSAATKWVFRGVNVLMLVYFTWALSLQFNDPQWLLSVLVYVAAIIVSVIALFDRIPSWVAAVTAVAVLLVDTVWLVAFRRHPDTCLPLTWDMCHEAQNLFGYMIIALWLAVIAARAVVREHRLVERHLLHEVV